MRLWPSACLLKGVTAASIRIAPTALPPSILGAPAGLLPTTHAGGTPFPDLIASFFPADAISGGQQAELTTSPKKNDPVNRKDGAERKTSLAEFASPTDVTVAISSAAVFLTLQGDAQHPSGQCQSGQTRLAQPQVEALAKSAADQVNGDVPLPIATTVSETKGPEPPAQVAFKLHLTAQQDNGGKATPQLVKDQAMQRPMPTSSATASTRNSARTVALSTDPPGTKERAPLETSVAYQADPMQQAGEAAAAISAASQDQHGTANESPAPNVASETVQSPQPTETPKESSPDTAFSQPVPVAPAIEESASSARQPLPEHAIIRSPRAQNAGPTELATTQQIWLPASAITISAEPASFGQATDSAAPPQAPAAVPPEQPPVDEQARATATAARNVAPPAQPIHQESDRADAREAASSHIQTKDSPATQEIPSSPKVLKRVTPHESSNDQTPAKDSKAQPGRKDAPLETEVKPARAVTPDLQVRTFAGKAEAVDDVVEPKSVQARTSVRIAPPVQPNSAVSSQPTRQISVQLKSEGSKPVEVQLIDPAGRIDVAVRTADRELAKSLQMDLGDLVGRLENKGFKTEAWVPSAARSSEVPSLLPAKPYNGNGQSGSSAGGKNSHSQDQGGSNQRQQSRSTAQFKKTLDETGAEK